MILLKEAGIKSPISDRSSHHRCSVRKGVLGNFTKFTGKHLCQSLFFNKVAGLWWLILFRSFGTLVRICRICEEDSFSRQSFVSSQWRKIFAAPRTKSWSDVLLMIRLLFIVPVSNAKLERMFSKLKREKSSFRCSLSDVWKISWRG